MMLPLATETWDEDEIVAIRRVVASKRFTMGPEVQAFEEEIAAFQRGTASVSYTHLTLPTKA